MFLFVVLATAVACGDSENQSATAPVSLYKYFGSVQCAGGGVTLADMERQLTEADIQVLSYDCGYDGKAYPAVCGAPDGRMGIFEIPAVQAPGATAAGFAPLSDLPAATKNACH
jgi:hypothetical protein